MEFFFISLHRYEQPNGYTPAPLDLSQVFLSTAHEEVVNLLAENDHNVWARERIRQGWTYGAQQVCAPCCIAASAHLLLEGRSTCHISDETFSDNLGL